MVASLYPFACLLSFVVCVRSQFTFSQSLTFTNSAYYVLAHTPHPPRLQESLGRVRMHTVLYRIVRHSYTFFTDYFVLRHWYQNAFRLVNNNDPQRVSTFLHRCEHVSNDNILVHCPFWSFRRGAMQSQPHPSFAVITQNHRLDPPGEP